MEIDELYPQRYAMLQLVHKGRREIQEADAVIPSAVTNWIRMSLHSAQEARGGDPLYQPNRFAIYLADWLLRRR